MPHCLLSTGTSPPVCLLFAGWLLHCLLSRASASRHLLLWTMTTARRVIAIIVNFIIYCTINVVIDVVVCHAVAIVVDIVICHVVAIVIVDVVVCRAVAIVVDVVVRCIVVVVVATRCAVAVIVDVVVRRAVAIIVVNFVVPRAVLIVIVIVARRAIVVDIVIVVTRRAVAIIVNNGKDAIVMRALMPSQRWQRRLRIDNNNTIKTRATMPAQQRQDACASTMLANLTNHCCGECTTNKPLALPPPLVLQHLGAEIRVN